jgi:hypothetical protein
MFHKRVIGNGGPVTTLRELRRGERFIFRYVVETRSALWIVGIIQAEN